MKDEIRKELEGLGSSLVDDKFKKGSEIPEDYFTKMQESVMQKLDQEVGKESLKRVPVLRLRKIIYASAALFILALGALIVFNLSLGNSSTIDQLDEESIYTYLNENLDGVSLEMLVSDTDLTESYFPENLMTDGVDEYLEENIEDLQLEDLENLL